MLLDFIVFKGFKPWGQVNTHSEMLQKEVILDYAETIMPIPATL